MRVMFEVSMATEAANEVTKQGELGSTIQSILEQTKPEAVYFGAKDGKRTVYMVVDMADASQIPAIAEPWFLAFNAEVSFQPVMAPEDLAKAGPQIEAAVKKFG